MKSAISRNRRRPAVVVHYVAVTTLIVAPPIIRDITAPVAVVLVVTFLAAVFTWLYAHTMSGASKFLDTKFENLDEREVQVTHEAYRRSYSVFGRVSTTIVIVVVIMFKSTPFEHDYSIFAPAMAVLYYISQTLPKSIIAWDERGTCRK